MRKRDRQTSEELYGDIISLPHPEPEKHKRMPLYKRAAQFAPFAALTGYGDAVEEAARYTEDYKELSEDETEQMDRKMMILQSKVEGTSGLTDFPEIRAVYFRPDEKKVGGAFYEISGRVKKIDGANRQLVMEDGRMIPIKNIIDLDGEIFDL